MLPLLRRILFHTVALASALLLLAILILWPVSYFREDTITDGIRPNRCVELSSAAGRVSATHRLDFTRPVGLDHFGGGLQFTGAWRSWSYGDTSTLDEDIRSDRLLGCQVSTVLPGSPIHSPARYVAVPYSYLALLSAITPTIWLLTRKRRRRRDRLTAGLCPICNYDLRGHAAIPNPRCPECGTPVETGVRG